MDGLLFVLQLVTTTMMTAVIWFVQVVHYPLFGLVGPGDFARYERAHTVRITPIVVPLMTVEALTAGLLLWTRPAWASGLELWCGAGLLVVIWTSTATLQAPAHQRLLDGLDGQVLRRLLASNWIRTLGWTVRLALVLLRLTRTLGLAR